MEIDDDEEVALAVDQIDEDAAEVSRPGGVQLAVDGDDDGALAAPDDDARKRRRRADRLRSLAASWAVRGLAFAEPLEVDALRIDPDRSILTISCNSRIITTGSGHHRHDD